MLRSTRAKNICLTASAFALAIPLAACGQAAAGTSDPPPATVQTVAGSDLHKLTLTPQAYGRLGIVTVPAGADSVPLAAVIYDDKGDVWVYTSPAPSTYVRTQVQIASVTGDTAHLTSGPPAGTPIVTVGTAELYGLEFGVGGEQ